MRRRIGHLIETHPLAMLLGIGLVLRLVAVWFARGYIATDDHFQVIEMAAQWLRGRSDFLAGGEQFYRSLLYPGCNWALMRLTHAVGIYHPDHVMLTNRLVHALFSLWTIALSYRLALRLEGKRAGWTAGLLTAAMAVMPFVSVRNLIEAISMPFLLWGIDQITRAEESSDRHATSAWILAGLALGISFVVRWQVATAIAGIGVYLIYRRQWRGLTLAAAAALSPVVIQGTWDWAWHGVFLGSLWAHLAYNAVHLYDYASGPWYRFLLLILGIFIPPFSFVFVAAMVRWIRRLGVLPWAAGAFLLAHSLVPNKQERFLLPILPLLIVMGTVGLELWGERKGTVWHRWVHRGWVWFWALNTPLLCLGLLDYANKPKIEPLLRLYAQGDATGVVMDFTERGRGTEMPWFYLDGADPAHPLPAVYDITHDEDLDTLRLRRDGLLPPKTAPLNYVVIFSEGGLPEHQAMIEQRLGKTEILAHVGPSAAERLMMFFNPTRFPAREVWVCRLVPGG